MVTSYAVLYKLEKDGFVVAEENTLFPNRKYYSITDTGKALIKDTRDMFIERFNLLFGESILE
jgi:DNA-binding PadR family transcriptional regulator